MIHANIADGAAFFGVAALTLLLMMFVYAVITADPEEATRTEAALMPPPALSPPPLPVREPQTLASPAFPTEGRPARADLAPQGAAASVALQPGVSPGPQRGSASALFYLIAGLALAVIGGGMFFRTGQSVTVCANQVLAICSDGFVVLHAAQLLGGALALGGIALISTAIVLALR